MNFIELLKLHARRYPLMQPCDAVKLVYQSVFGGGHMISDESTALSRLKQEYGSISHNRPFRFEPLGRCARVYIDSPLSERELTLIGRIFCTSAKHFAVGYDYADKDTRQQFERRLSAVVSLAKEGAFAFTPDELSAYLRDYRAAGCPAVSHSEAYRTAYAPAYRVIDARYVRLWDCIRAIDTQIREKTQESTPCVAAIDGRCASGKTTAASMLAELFGGQVVHMDDFFLPFDMRTPERLTEPGGNLHRERYLDEVAAHIREGEFSYRVFDCSTGGYKPQLRRIEKAPLIICEGAYALHPAFGDYSDLRIFSTITPDKQERRILARDGEAMLERFRKRWIPMEERYIEAYNIEKNCEIILK